WIFRRRIVGTAVEISDSGFRCRSGLQRQPPTPTFPARHTARVKSVRAADAGKRAIRRNALILRVRAILGEPVAGRGRWRISAEGPVDTPAHGARRRLPAV